MVYGRVSLFDGMTLVWGDVYSNVIYPPPTRPGPTTETREYVSTVWVQPACS